MSVVPLIHMKLPALRSTNFALRERDERQMGNETVYETSKLLTAAETRRTLEGTANL